MSNVFVLRGFCQKILNEGSASPRVCGAQLEFGWDVCKYSYPKHAPNPEWFLSAKQMNILYKESHNPFNNEIKKFMPPIIMRDNDGEAICAKKILNLQMLLKENPFLVSLILNETERVESEKE